MIILSGRNLLVPVLCLWAFGLAAQDKRPMEVTDIMKFQQVRAPSISQDGKWVALTAQPDRGDPRVLVYSSDGKVKYELAGGRDPVISGDGKWVAAIKAVPAKELLLSEKGKEKEQVSKTGMVLLHTASGEQQTYENVKSFTFSNNSSWLVFQQNGKKKEDKKNGELETGTTLILMELEEGETDTLSFVSTYALDSISQHLAYVVSDSVASGNGIYTISLSGRFKAPVAL